MNTKANPFFLLPKSTARPVGTSGFPIGIRDRLLDDVVLATMQGSPANVATTYTLKLKNLSNDLTVNVACGLVPSSPNGIFLPSTYPAAPGTLQVIPLFDKAGGPLAVREVFQDPTAVDNANHAVPQNLPYAWTFNPGAVPDALIVVAIPLNAYALGPGPGNLIVRVGLAYDGIDINDGANAMAVSRALSRVQLLGILARPDVYS